MTTYNCFQLVLLSQISFVSVGVFVVYKFALNGQQFPCQTGKGNRLTDIQFLQGQSPWRMLLCKIIAK